MALPEMSILANYDAAHIDVYSANNDEVILLYGLQGSYTYFLPNSIYETLMDYPINPNAPTYHFTWILDNLQQSIDVIYQAAAQQNNEQFGNQEWTQLGLDAQVDDIITFPDVIDSRVGTILELAGKISQRGWCFVEEWSSLSRLIYLTSEKNTVEWADGR